MAWLGTWWVTWLTSDDDDGGGRRIVDAGVFPILPSAHLSATVYAVAEKVSSPDEKGARGFVVGADKLGRRQAASIIIEDWRDR